LTSTYQIIYWRDIPAQVRVRDDRERFSQPLELRFQQAIDEAAMHSGLTGTDAYLNEWRSSDWQSKEGEPEFVAKSVALELEASYSQEHLDILIQNNGHE
jgi:hypothetical protein